MTCGEERLYQELSYVAYHFHWGHNELMDLDHLTRRRYVEEIASINHRIRDGS